MPYRLPPNTGPSDAELAQIAVTCGVRAAASRRVPITVMVGVALVGAALVARVVVGDQAASPSKPLPSGSPSPAPARERHRLAARDSDRWQAGSCGEDKDCWEGSRGTCVAYPAEGIPELTGPMPCESFDMPEPCATFEGPSLSEARCGCVARSCRWFTE
jgi:hypothetical protein